MAGLRRGNLRFARRLYLGPKASRHTGTIKWKLRHGAGMVGIYCITLPAGREDEMEIYHNSVLLQSYFRRKEICVVGIAEGYGEALELVKRIVADAFRETGTLDARAFFGMAPEKKG